MAGNYEDCAPFRGQTGRSDISDEELASYDALETNHSAVRVLGDETLKNRTYAEIQHDSRLWLSIVRIAAATVN